MISVEEVNRHHIAIQSVGTFLLSLGLPYHSIARIRNIFFYFSASRFAYFPQYLFIQNQTYIHM